MTHLRTAFVLAAGLGTRMRPLTNHVPKPLVRLGGRTLIDHVLDRIAAAGIERAVVNVHHLADQIERHLEGRSAPKIVISDERHALLDTGGGLKRALALLGPGAFLIHNSDSVWIERSRDNIRALIEAWDETRMDTLMLLADRASSLGYDGKGDFLMDRNGVLTRRSLEAESDLVFAGVSIAHPRLLASSPDGAFSLNLLWDRASAAGRLFGLRLDGEWMHVGTPDSLAAAERRLAGRDGV